MSNLDYKGIDGEKWSIEKGDWVSYQNYEPNKKSSNKFKITDLSVLIIIITLVFALSYMFSI